MSNVTKENTIAYRVTATDFRNAKNLDLNNTKIQSAMRFSAASPDRWAFVAPVAADLLGEVGAVFQAPHGISPRCTSRPALV